MNVNGMTCDYYAATNEFALKKLHSLASPRKRASNDLHSRFSRKASPDDRFSYLVSILLFVFEHRLSSFITILDGHNKRNVIIIF